MSLELAAQHLASRGRKGDSMLVHMAPEEVSGLQALAKAAGGTLTLNPDTGLPEANFLKQLLPMIIGAGITAATGGAAAPWMIGLGMGGLETVRTGSLEKGLMAGLGAYGGAGLAGGLAAAGAASPTAAAQALGTPAATGAGSQSAMLAAQNAGFGQAGIDALASSAGTAAGAAPVATNVFSAGANALGTEAGRSAALSSMGGGMGAAKYGLAALSPAMQIDPATPYDGGKANYEYTYDPNTSSYTQVPVGTRDKMGRTPSYYAVGGPIQDMSDRNQMETLMANGGQMFAGGGQINLQGTFDMGGGGGGGQFGQANANGYQAAGSGNSNQLFSGGFGTPGGIDPRAAQADPEGFQRWQQMAQQREQQMPGSTMMSGMGGGFPGQLQGLQEQMRSGDFSRYGQAMSLPGRPGGGFAEGGMASMARGGPSHLGDYSDGGRLLKGPGDGVSDSIPATIADKRPARLADGEFVVPARIVSELGNGSTEAGARKLYAMMDRVQKARGKTTGKNRVAVNSRAEKLLPA